MLSFLTTGLKGAVEVVTVFWEQAENGIVKNVNVNPMKIRALGLFFILFFFTACGGDGS